MEPEALPIIPPRGVEFRLSPTFTMPLVSALDRIRLALEKAYPGGEMDEMAWFIREYPRAYRYHLKCADFRLETIARLYQELHVELAQRLTDNGDLFEVSQSDLRVQTHLLGLRVLLNGNRNRVGLAGSDRGDGL